MPYLPQEIIQKVVQLNIEEVAHALGISVNRHEARCFMHDDRRPSLKFHRNGHLWKCFVCDVGGDSITLVMRSLGIDYIDACLWLCNQFGIYVSNIEYKRRLFPYLKKYSSHEQETSNFNSEIGEWLISTASLSLEAKKFLFVWRNRGRLGQGAGGGWDTFDVAKLMIFSETVAF